MKIYRKYIHNIDFYERYCSTFGNINKVNIDYILALQFIKYRCVFCGKCTDKAAIELVVLGISVFLFGNINVEALNLLSLVNLKTLTFHWSKYNDCFLKLCGIRVIVNDQLGVSSV